MNRGDGALKMKKGRDADLMVVTGGAGAASDHKIASWRFLLYDYIWSHASKVQKSEVPRVYLSDFASFNY